MVERRDNLIIIQKDEDVVFDGKDGYEGWGAYSNSERFYFVEMLNELDPIDTYLVDEESGLGYRGFFGLYCTNTDLAFYMSKKDIYDYADGKEIILEGFDPEEDQEIVEAIERWKEA